MFRALYFLFLLCFVGKNALASELLINGKKASTKQNVVIVASADKDTTITFLPIFQNSKGSIIWLTPIKNEYKIIQSRTINPQPIKDIYSYSSSRKEIIKERNPNSSYQEISDFEAVGHHLPNSLSFAHVETLILDRNSTIEFLQKNKVDSDFCNDLKSLYDNSQQFLLAVAQTKQEINSLEPVQVTLEEKGNKFELLDVEKNSDLIFITKSGQVKNGKKQNKNLSLIYSWPIYECKPCVNPIPTMQDLHTLGVNWYKKPKEGLMGLISPSAVIYVTNYKYTGQKSNLNFTSTNLRPKIQRFSDNQK